MLARTFLPAANLKITEKQRDALIAALVMLEGGEIEWRKAEHRNLRKGEKLGFNMIDWNCGTAVCMGGLCDTMGAGFMDMQTMPVDLEKLFYPALHLTSNMQQLTCMWDITVPQAARALRNYLERGKSDWASVLA